MSQEIYVVGGNYVSSERWLETLRALGATASWQGNACVGAEAALTLKFSHKALGADETELFFHYVLWEPAADMPVDVVARRRREMANFRDRRPRSWTDHHEGRLALLEGGPAALASFYEKRRATESGRPDANPDEIAYWAKLRDEAATHPDCKPEQKTIFLNWNDAVALCFVAAAYNLAANGEIVLPMQKPRKAEELATADAILKWVREVCIDVGGSAEGE